MVHPHILMLGNSLTTANDLPLQIGQILRSDVEVLARGGARLAEFLNPKTRNGARFLETMANCPWDFVVLQEMSHGPATSRDSYLRSVNELCARITSAGVTPVLYGTWAYSPTCPKLEKLGFTHESMHELMHASFVEAAQQTGARLADVGSAFETAASGGTADSLSALEALYAADGVHPSPAGTRIAAQVLAETMM